MIEIALVCSTEAVATVYNLRVADHHTYFVGGALWGWDVWVHNANVLYASSSPGSRSIFGGKYVESIFTNGKGRKAITRSVFKNTQDFDGAAPAFVHSSVNATVRNKIANGYNNKMLMQEGYAPIGRDGKSINLHHILGDEPGPMIELSQSIHQQSSKVLHNLIEDGKSFRNISRLEAQYERFAEKWWMVRSNDF